MSGRQLPSSVVASGIIGGCVGYRLGSTTRRIDFAANCDLNAGARDCVRDHLHVHGCRRGNHRIHGDAADRVAARRPALVQLGVLVFSIGSNRDDGGFRQSVGSVWSQAGDPGGNRHFFAGLGACGVCRVDVLDDRLPLHSRHRCGRDADGGDDDRGRFVPSARAWKDSRISCQHLGNRRRARPHSRRRHHPQRLVGMGVLAQYSDRFGCGGRLHCIPA